jgi:ABC-type multidrug transport system ATPase subunit
MSAIIKVDNLSKQYHEVKAVNDISFTVNTGDIYGFLGQNGAGKSTTIRMLLTLIAPTAGNIELFGKNLHANRKEVLQQIGAVIEKPDLYKYLTGYENLSLFARMSGVRVTQKKLAEQLEQVGLTERAHSKVRTYSQGMKQRLGIAIALIHDPKLIILDEPTNGLDPQGIADIRNLILHLSRHQGKTILVSSHLLHEIELIANRMLIIDKGKKIMEGTVAELVDPARTRVHLEVTNPQQVVAWLQSSRWSTCLQEQNNTVILLQMNKQQVPELTADLVKAGANITALQPQNSLESYFLSLTTENRHVDTFTN